MKKIAIIGAGGFGREVKMLIDQINQHKKKFSLIGFFDDNFDKGVLIDGLPVLGNINDINRVKYDIGVVLAIGDPEVKKRIYNCINNEKIFFPTLIHPNVLLDSVNVEIGNGCIITAGNIITTNIKIGNHVILNLCCTVGHDSVIGDFSSIMPSVNVSGEVNLSEGVYVGTGAKIINKITIGKYTTLGAGAVVSKDIPEYSIAVGIPAKIIKIKNKK